MRPVVFVAPFLKETTLRFARAVGQLEDVAVLGVCSRQSGGVPQSVRQLFTDIVEIDNALDAAQIEAAAREHARNHGELHRIVSVLEQAQLAVAQARARLGLPGLPPDAAERFLNKSVMKAALRAAGLPVARDRLVATWEEACAFIEEVGFPVVIKPPVGAACAATFQVENHHQLGNAFGQIAPSRERPAQVEEFVHGREFSYDTVTIDGEVRTDSITHYLPSPIDVMRNPWIKWSYLAPREIHGGIYEEARRIGIAAVKALGMVSGITHMEWFAREDGSVVIGEVAARPPGAQITPMMGLLHDTDFFRVWARAVVDGAFDGPWERKWAGAAIFLRGEGYGRVAGLSGLDEIRRRWGHLIVDDHPPEHGAPKTDSYEGEGWMLLRGEHTAEVDRARQEILSIVRVWYA